ncbi:glycoside hydrolase family 95 protein [Novosphingobium sp.]|uniref:glycoside hydrolase family 95 protein n=1 Tax=Novosphingobium sp. TaxID=1874826 RepID=UPI002FDD0E3A
MDISRRHVIAGSIGATLVPANLPARTAATGEAEGDPHANTLWYRQPAAVWNEALPLGNGRLGAMVFGGTAQERIQVNAQTLWGGAPHDYDGAPRDAQLALLRQAIFDGNLAEAERLGEGFLGDPKVLCPYQPFVDLGLGFAGHDAAQDYRRSLDLARGVHTVSYRVGQTRFRRECFVSFPDKVLVVRLSADRPGALDAAIALTSKLPGVVVRRDHAGGAGGSQVRGADEIVLVLAGATSFRRYDDISGDPAADTQGALGAVATMPWTRLLARHEADHAGLFGRVDLSLGDPATAAMQPTDLRLKAYAAAPDPALEALYFQYGRYLLIASSRPGGQPANLQGIWNDELLPAWSSKWTTNINLQMNYWIAETGDLWDMQEPLWDLIADLAESGTRTARNFYKARGWVLHHNTDLWRATAPVDGSWGIWPMGGVWLSNQMWDHYLFSEDRAFLAQKAYDPMRGAVLFALDFLVPAPAGSPLAGHLVTCPSISPENQYRKDGASHYLTYAATMDIALLDELFGNFAEAARLLGRDAELAEAALEVRRRLPPVRVGARGQVMEWAEDFAEAEPDHRHTSHLYGLYPGRAITPQRTPALARAAARTLDLRGDGGTGWSMAWRTALRARLGDGAHAHTMLRALIGQFTLPNMFDVCPPFQIDGNFGGPAGMAEMLLQSGRGEVSLLPALPPAWGRGTVRGLRARGNLKVDMRWSDHALTHAVIHAARPARLAVTAMGRTQDVVLHVGANPVRLG